MSHTRSIITILFLLACLDAENVVTSGAVQTDASRSPELEEAAKLTSELPSLLDWHKYDEALAAAKKALDLRGKVLGQSHELVASSLGSVADIYVAMKKYDAAEQTLETSRSRYRI